MEGSQCYMLQTYSNWISIIIKYLLSAFCQMCTDTQSWVLMFYLFSPFFTPLQPHRHLTWTWKFWELEIFRSKSHSKVLKSNIDKIVIGSMKLFLYSWNITFVSQHPWSIKRMFGFCTKHNLTGTRFSCTSQLPGMIAGDNRNETMTGHAQMKPLSYLCPYTHMKSSVILHRKK